MDAQFGFHLTMKYGDHAWVVQSKNKTVADTDCISGNLCSLPAPMHWIIFQSFANFDATLATPFDDVFLANDQISPCIKQLRSLCANLAACDTPQHFVAF